jgi:Fur family ferric uptake transcriptional regulator
MKARLTRSQDKVLQLLQKLNREISAQELYIELRKVKSPLGLATIYRALEGLKVKGAVQARVLSNGETLYNKAQTDRHHLTCLQCGISIPITESDCPVHELETHLRQSAQFEIYYHTLEFFGLCSPCQLEQVASESSLA